jgi:hypothetical protein
MHPPPRLFGRTGELEILGRLIANARSGRSAVLVVRGEPGIGKTELLRQLIAEASGFGVARVAGRLHPRRPRYQAPRGPPGQVVQQSGLAHAGLTAHHQRPALTGLRVSNEPVKYATFAGPARQLCRGAPGTSMCRHRPGATRQPWRRCRLARQGGSGTSRRVRLARHERSLRPPSQTPPTPARQPTRGDPGNQGPGRCLKRDLGHRVAGAARPGCGLTGSPAGGAQATVSRDGLIAAHGNRTSAGSSLSACAGRPVTRRARLRCSPLPGDHA